ncbi:MAG: cobalamin-binding protein [Planctomycetota bacterium]|nr:cobalamin-binding protein [Planctomycetota bacterium]
MRDSRKTLVCALAAGCLVAAVWFAASAGWGPFRPKDRDTLQPRDGRPRIASLAPSVTEILFAIGAQDLVVGVTDVCDYPPEAKRFPSIGNFGRPNTEALLAARPTHVIADGMDPAIDAGYLSKFGIKLVDLRIGNVREVLAAILEIGRIAGKNDGAKGLVESMQAELDRMSAESDSIPPGSRPRVFVEVWNSPLTTAGKGSFIDDIISLAGGVNVARDLDKPYAPVSAEKIVEWNPDVIILGYMTEAHVNRDDIGERIGWSGIAAVKNGRIVRDVPPDYLFRPGPRLVAAVKMVAERLKGVCSSSGSE